MIYVVFQEYQNKKGIKREARTIYGSKAKAQAIAERNGGRVMAHTGSFVEV